MEILTNFKLMLSVLKENNLVFSALFDFQSQSVQGLKFFGLEKCIKYDPLLHQNFFNPFVHF